MSHEKDQFHVHNDFIVPQSGDSGVAFGHVHGSQGMSQDEIRHRIAEEHGNDPANITVFNPRTGEVSSAPSGKNRPTKTWGFTKWAANWEPTGPNGDPKLN